MIKKLIDLPSGHKAEAVYFEDDRKQVICFSTQLNCAVGCGFCASTKAGGKTINLTVEDMIHQIWTLDEEFGHYDRVMLYSIMGEGEPFLNYTNVIETMKWMQRRKDCKIAVSTSGYKIRKFAHEKFNVPVKLQVSVHAADYEIRKQLVPNAPSIAYLVEDIAYYHKHNYGEVELNFALISGVNDSDRDMQYIRYNFPNEHIVFTKLNCGKDNSPRIERCLKYLRDYGMSVEYKESPGTKIAAGCGQTRGISVEIDEAIIDTYKKIHTINRMHDEAANSTMIFGKV